MDTLVGNISSDYYIELGLKTRYQKPFTLKFFRGFIKRSPDLNVLLKAMCIGVPICLLMWYHVWYWKHSTHWQKRLLLLLYWLWCYYFALSLVSLGTHNIRDGGKCDSWAADDVALVGWSNSAIFKKYLQHHFINLRTVIAFVRLASLFLSQQWKTQYNLQCFGSKF